MYSFASVLTLFLSVVVGSYSEGIVSQQSGTECLTVYWSGRNPSRYSSESNAFAQMTRTFPIC